MEWNVLTLADFEIEKDDESVDAIFAGLYNISNVQTMVKQIIAMVSIAEKEERDPADVLADSHMVFVGPPGTGKTTVARRMGRLFKKLHVLPSDDVIVVSGTSLQGTYVGETKTIVRKAMSRAKGGILFVDEAYSLCNSKHSNETYTSSYAMEAVETMISLMTEEEFKGNLLVILAGYEDEMEKLFKSVNPGFRSRFDKYRLKFDAWTASQALNATIEEVKRAGNEISSKCHDLLLQKYERLTKLQGWASARDVVEIVLTV